MLLESQRVIGTNERAHYSEDLVQTLTSEKYKPGMNFFLYTAHKEQEKYFWFVIVATVSHLQQAEWKTRYLKRHKINR
jgi:hypothetical protein